MSKSVLVEDARLKTKVRKEYLIANLTDGIRSVIGDEICFAPGSNTYAYSAVVVSSFARLYRVSRADLLS